ncbi:MAG: response regulator [Nonlabens sp.]
MINVIIIDDESHGRSLLHNLLEKELGDQYQLKDSCSSVKEGVKAIREHKVDLVFLDIQMPEEDGFELFNYFENIDFEIIFVTAFDQYAIKAFQCSALHYLLKPVDPVQLHEAIERYKKSKENKKAILKKFDVFAEYIEGQQEKKRIVFNTTTGFEVVVIKELVHIAAEGNYSQLYFKDVSNKLVTSSLKGIEDCLPDSYFLRIHHGHIINLNAVHKFTKTDREVTLINGDTLKVAERKLKLFLSRISEAI